MIETLIALERYYGKYLHNLPEPLTATFTGGRRMKPEYVLYVCRKMIEQHGSVKLAFLFLAELCRYRGDTILPLERREWSSIP